MTTPKPTPTHHLIHWLNSHPTPHENIPGTPFRFADAHDHLVGVIDDYEDKLEKLKEEIVDLSDKHDEVVGKLDKVTFHSKREIDRIINLPTTCSDTADHLEGLRAFVEEYE